MSFMVSTDWRLGIVAASAFGNRSGAFICAAHERDEKLKQSAANNTEDLLMLVITETFIF